MINWRLENIEDGDMIPGFAVFDDSEQYGAGAVVAYIPQKYHHHGHLITAAPALLRALHDVMLEHAPPGMEPDGTENDCPCQACKNAYEAIVKAKGLMEGFSSS
jgi:hypothetical protein